MPELPEVETIARQLRDLVVGRRIAAFDSFWHRVTEPVPAAHFATRLVGGEVAGVGRGGRFVVLELDGDEALIVSLRMTGKLLFREPGAPDDTFVRAVIRFADGTALRFSDTRKFGRMAIVDRADLVENGDRPRSRAGEPLHRVLGIEPLTPRFTTRWLRPGWDAARIPDVRPRRRAVPPLRARRGAHRRRRPRHVPLPAVPEGAQPAHRAAQDGQMSVLSVQAVARWYGEREVLKDVS